METTATITKEKRIKRVFSGIEKIVHLWAHQSQPDARGGNSFFEGPIIYSYGYHFPIARIYTKVKGKGKNKTEEKVVFFTTATYSSTTSGHVSCVRQASSHMHKMYMHFIPKAEDPMTSFSVHKDNLAYWCTQINKALGMFDSARENKEYLLREARAYVTTANEYIKFFELKGNITKQLRSVSKQILDEKWDLEVAVFKARKAKRIEHYEANKTEIDKQRDKLKAKKAKAALAKAIEKSKERIATWRAGNYVRLAYEDLYGNTLLRYNEEKERVETSQGVQIPKEIAHRFYRHIVAVLHNGGCHTTEKCAYKVLDYQVKNISNEYIQVGCHHVPMDEVQMIVKQLNW